MPKDLANKLVLAISSSALFDLKESNQVFEEAGVDAYSDYQVRHENDPFRPGMAFYLVKKFLKLNQETQFVEVILVSRNSADTGLRVFNSIAHYKLDITRAAFTSGENIYPYITAFGSHLFLSANSYDVKQALDHQCAAATLLSLNDNPDHKDQLRIAFDGDAVLFSDESERIFHESGLTSFTQNEMEKANLPLLDGPFKGFLSALHRIQNFFNSNLCPIRTALITARSAPTHERVIRTLRSWGIRVDESVFLGGLSKTEFLKAFGADVFFDDQHHNCHEAMKHVTTAHVPHGVKNEN